MKKRTLIIILTVFVAIIFTFGMGVSCYASDSIDNDLSEDWNSPDVDSPSDEDWDLPSDEEYDDNDCDESYDYSNDNESWTVSDRWWDFPEFPHWPRVTVDYGHFRLIFDIKVYNGKVHWIPVEGGIFFD